VRSLTLDVTSFTPDLVELLCQIGNRVSNYVWEAKADPSQKPNAQSSRESRLKYITAKYVHREYVAPLSPTLSAHTSPDEVLLDAVKKNDLSEALYALALHANPNAVDPSASTSIIMLALQAADTLVASSSSNSSESELSPTTPGPAPPITFPLTELLLQNCGEIPLNVSTQGLSQSARNYVSHKTAKRLQQSNPAPARGTSQHDTSPPLSLKERQQREKERLQKRVSSGARLHRAPILER
jgi:Arf-GAP/SH3 domain/ANK repeat/PH domain-containing protein